jgi:hypothetical protein
MSYTLGLIMKYWKDEIPKEPGYTDLPFDIESFCIENDRERITREIDNGIIIALQKTKIEELENKIEDMECNMERYGDGMDLDYD